MSKSSSAIFASLFSGVFNAAMRNAAPILFWSAIIILVGTSASWVWVSLTPLNQTSQAFETSMLFSGLVQAVSNAVWPFTGAAIVWIFQKREIGAAE